MSETKVWVRVAEFVLIGLAALSLYQEVAWAAAAEKFPSREVILVVQFSPGGNTDVNARLLVPYLQKELGVPVIVENRSEAGGVKAITDVYRAKPDGYTLLVNVFPQNAQKELIFDVPFKILDFTYLAGFTRSDMFVSVVKDSPIKSLKNLVEVSKKKSLNVSVSQLGSNGHLNAMILKRRAGVNLEVVPYPGESQAMTALLGGHVDIISATDTTVWLQRERVRPLVVFSAKRTPNFPDVPTFKESGYDIVSDSQVGISGPPALPANIQKILSAALAKAIQNPEIATKLQAAGSVLYYASGPDFHAAARSAHNLVSEYKDIFEEPKK
jgi:tripartite-type tricarboxylate transporter receptor subunit TctC